MEHSNVGKQIDLVFSVHSVNSSDNTIFYYNTCHIILYLDIYLYVLMSRQIPRGGNMFRLLLLFPQCLKLCLAHMYGICGAIVV